MKTAARFAVTGSLSLAVAALIAGTASASQNAESSSAPVFVQSDNPAANTVVAYDRAANGSLRQAGTYPPGGLGGVLAAASLSQAFHAASSSPKASQLRAASRLDSRNRVSLMVLSSLRLPVCSRQALRQRRQRDSFGANSGK